MPATRAEGMQRYRNYNDSRDDSIIRLSQHAGVRSNRSDAILINAESRAHERDVLRNDNFAR